MENEEIACEAKKLKLVIIVMSLVVLALFGLAPII